MNPRLFPFLVCFLVLLWSAGCQNKGPVPAAETTGERAPVASAETSGAHPGGANPRPGDDAHANDPHAGIAPAPATGSIGLGEDGLLDVGDVAFKVPDGWQAQVPRSTMRRAQIVVNGDGGPAELIVFYFGPQGAGSAKDNINRWIGQFSEDDGTPVTSAVQSSDKVAGRDVNRVEVAGRYSGGMGPAAAQGPKDDQRMIAAIVATSGGPYYFKLTGPDATVDANRGAFDSILQSIVDSP